MSIFNSDVKNMHAYVMNDSRKKYWEFCAIFNILKKFIHISQHKSKTKC